MPIVRIDLFPGRSPEKKQELARAISRVFETVAGSAPKDVTVQFSEVSPSDWFVAGEALGASTVGGAASGKERE